MLTMFELLIAESSPFIVPPDTVNVPALLYIPLPLESIVPLTNFIVPEELLYIPADLAFIETPEPLIYINPIDSFDIALLPVDSIVPPVTLRAGDDSEVAVEDDTIAFPFVFIFPDVTINVFSP